MSLVSPVSCPSCSAPRPLTESTGTPVRFCSACGAPFEGARCADCGADLVSGAKFCHRCGIAVGARRARGAARDPSGDPGGLASSLPWAVAGIALVALVALVAGQRFGARERGDRIAQPGVAGGATTAGALGGGIAAGGGIAPDISSMTPREQAERLFNRVMQLDAQRQQDSAAYATAGGDERLQFFATMAIQAYQRVAPLDAGVRYDMGRIAIAAGVTPVARAQADTILHASPTHLLGLVLGTRAARAAGDERRALDLEQRLLAAAAAERAKELPEYHRHAAEIDEALVIARRQ